MPRARAPPADRSRPAGHVAEIPVGLNHQAGTAQTASRAAPGSAAISIPRSRRGRQDFSRPAAAAEPGGIGTARVDRGRAGAARCPPARRGRAMFQRASARTYLERIANIRRRRRLQIWQKGDVIDLWSSLYRLSLREAALDLARTFHLEPTARGTEKRNG